jgi:M6 family metalloprotease-like protein
MSKIYRLCSIFVVLCLFVAACMLPGPTPTPTQVSPTVAPATPVPPTPTQVPPTVAPATRVPPTPTVAPTLAAVSGVRPHATLVLGGGAFSDPRVVDAVVAGTDWPLVSDNLFPGEDVPIAVEVRDMGQIYKDARQVIYDPTRMKDLLSQAGLSNIPFTFLAVPEEGWTDQIVKELEPFLPGPIDSTVKTTADKALSTLEVLVARGATVIWWRPFVPAAPQGYTFEGGVPANAGNPAGLNQATLVIFVRASDDNTANLVALRTSEQAEFTDVATFWRESSFNKLGFAFTFAPANGWYQLANTYDDYMWTNADIAAAQAMGNAKAIQQAQDNQNLVQDFSGFFTHSLQAAESDGFAISGFTTVVVVVIGPFHRGTSYGTTNFTLQAGGNNFQVAVPVVVVSTNTGWSRTAHEFGHAFPHMADQYGGTNRGLDGYDIMDCTDCSAQTTGWNKDEEANWFTGTQLKPLARPAAGVHVTDVTTLIPYETENPAAGAVQSLRLDVGGSMHLYVENRQQQAGQIGSQALPDYGVLISDADDNADQANASRVPSLLFGGPLGNGEQFTDSTYGPLKIAAASVAGTQNMQVTVDWGPDPFMDLRIEEWDPPPYESVDIWIDSPANGWNVYEYTDGAGNPIRNGDRPQVGQVNHVYARVHNDGNYVMNDVWVSIDSTTPPGLGDTGNWSLLDRVKIPTIQPGDDEVAPAVNWRPSVNAHSCLRATVNYRTGELNANNNQAHENVDEFTTTQGSPWQPIYTELDVSNPTPVWQNVHIEVSGLPAGWRLWVSERFIDLAPGETKRIRYAIDPGTSSIPDDRTRRVDVHIAGWLTMGDGPMLLGGVTNSVHMVEKSSVSIDPRGIGPQVSLEKLKSAAKELGAYVTVSPGRAGLPVALEVRDIRSGVSALVPGTTGTGGRVLITLDLLLETFPFDMGRVYAMRGIFYGTTDLDSGVSPSFVFVITP